MMLETEGVRTLETNYLTINKYCICHNALMGTHLQINILSVSFILVIQTRDISIKIFVAFLVCFYSLKFKENIDMSILFCQFTLLINCERNNVSQI